MRGFAWLICFISLTLFLQTGCVGPLKDVRIGKNYLIYTKDKIPVYTRPLRGGEVFYIDRTEAFVVEDVVCEDGMSTAMCWLDLASIPGASPDVADKFTSVAFYKVRFESGVEGYINAVFFYPSVADGILSEKTTIGMHGMTAVEFAQKIRDDDAEDEARFRADSEIRRKIIADAPWPERIKRLVEERGLELGMTHKQVILSQAPVLNYEDFPLSPFGRLAFEKVTEEMTKEGLKETWVYWSYRSVTVKRYEEKNMIPREEAKPRIVSAANGIYKIYEERETLGKTGRVRISEVVYEKAAEYYFVGGRLAGWKFFSKALTDGSKVSP
mgnify:CR=1 FL=1